jgi:hypothetical protein
MLDNVLVDEGGIWLYYYGSYIVFVYICYWISLFNSGQLTEHRTWEMKIEEWQNPILQDKRFPAWYVWPCTLQHFRVLNTDA